MNDSIKIMLDQYACHTVDDYINALREILQNIALLGLWRSKFFEHAAFYGGTALRILYGLDRYSEDLDFSLIKPDPHFNLTRYGQALEIELRSFGFDVTFEYEQRIHDEATATRRSSIESAFLKTNTLKQLIHIDIDETLAQYIHPRKLLKIKLEIDIDPPLHFQTETGYVMQPIPFPVKVYALPDLFAGKMHAVLCRKWESRVKGRDYYDLIWYLANYPQINLQHLETRMRYSGDYNRDESLTRNMLLAMLKKRINNLDIEQIKKDVFPFIRNKSAIDVWSEDFFLKSIERIRTE